MWKTSRTVRRVLVFTYLWISVTLIGKRSCSNSQKCKSSSSHQIEDFVQLACLVVVETLLYTYNPRWTPEFLTTYGFVRFAYLKIYIYTQRPLKTFPSACNVSSFCVQYYFNLHLAKCELFEKCSEWRGYFISEDDVRLDPSWNDGIRKIEYSKCGADL